MRPASSADSGRVRLGADALKKARAARWIPYAPSPKYTVLRYCSRIHSFDCCFSSCQAREASRSFLPIDCSRPTELNAFRTYCCVMVEPPSSTPPVARLT
jgi:hypothetical protein